MDTPENPEEKQHPTISIKIRVDTMTDTVIKDTEKGLHLLLVALPLTTPKLTALGFLWSVLMNMTDFYNAAEQVANAQKGGASKSGIVKATVGQALELGKRLRGG